MSIDKPTRAWAKTLGSLDILHHYDRTFGAIAGVWLSLLFPPSFFEELAPSLVE